MATGRRERQLSAPHQPAPVCLIPARGGSKRFPRKNIALLKGKPLLGYSIETALGSGIFQGVWVSTEDPDIAAVAKAYGASIHPRPEALATDDSTVVQVALELLDWLDERQERPDTLGVVLPTAVLMEGEDLRRAHAMSRRDNVDGVIAVTSYLESPLWALQEVDGHLRPFFGAEQVKPGSKPPELCVDSGSFYFMNVQALRRHRTFYSDRTVAYQLPRSRSIDIDRPEDLAIAEALLEHSLRSRASAVVRSGVPSGTTARRVFITGERIYLRPFETTDLDGPYLEWLNDPEVTRFLETGLFPTTLESLRSYFERVAQTPDNVMLAICDKSTDRHIGNIKLGPIHWLHRRADMGILIGDRDSRGVGVGREAVGLMLAYGFDTLNLHKLTLGVYADHAQAVKVYQELGFRIEGTLKEHLFREGRYHDKYLMGLARDEWAPAGRGL